MFYLFSYQHSQGGYTITKDTITFSYAASGSLKKVYLSGNFNDWTKDNEGWKMTFDANTRRWELKKSFIAIHSYGNFLEFTFRVNGKLIDADRSANNIIYCAGYVYRYVIR
jgi:hypothetical protein